MSLRKITKVLIISTLICIASIKSTYAILINGNEPTASGKCDPSKPINWCGQYGVSWRRYPVSYPVENSGPGNASAQSKCSGITDSYYLLAYEQVEGGRYRGRQANRPGVQVFQVNLPENTSYDRGQGYNYNFVKFDDTEGWSDVANKFQTAKNNGGPSSSGADWATTTWFCYDDSWTPSTPPPVEVKPEAKGQVSAKSIINIPNNQNGFIVDGDSTRESAWSGDNESQVSVTAYTTSLTFNANIKHSLKYERIDSQGGDGYPNSSTTFTVDNYANTAGMSFNLGSSKVQIDDQYDNPKTFNFDASKANERQEQEQCQTIQFRSRNFWAKSGDTDASNSDSGSSKACIKVVYTPPSDEHKNDLEGEFWSTSSVEIGEPETSQNIGKQTSAKNGKVTVELSTDSPILDVTFSHNMNYSNNLAQIGSSSFDTCTNDGSPIVSYSSGLSGNIDGISKFCTGGSLANQDKEVSSNRLTIGGGSDSNGPIAEGSTREVCQKITYQPQNFNIKQTEHLRWDGNNLVHSHYTYSNPVGTGQEDSEACVKVTRVKGTGGDDPDPDNPGPTSSGTGHSSVLFAGETANIGWQAKAQSYPTRRLVELRPIGLLIKDTVNFPGANNLSGSIGSTNKADPCTWYRSRLSSVFCDALEINGDDDSYNSNGTIVEDQQQKFNKQVGEQQDIIVPDGVGFKYCNSFGFKWQYWWGVQQEGQETSWNHVDDKDYWTNYNAICRTIAKKPSTAVWNGSIFSQFQIASSLATRINGDTMSQGVTIIDNNQPRTTYGSWIEHTLISNGDIRGFASGSSLARGREGKLDSFSESLNKLSIANSGIDSTSKKYSGNADIRPNSTTLVTRLKAYLKNNQEVEKVSEITGLNGLSKGGMKVYVAEGDLKITGNISNAGTYQNIYEIPQVIIFAEKDDAKIDISSDVTRIDAWIIAPNGTINTCSDLTSSVGTRTLSYNTNTICDKQLQINGPVIAKNLKLNRTFGADGYSYGGASQKYTPSEIFNLSGASYLWAYAQSGRYSSSYSEAYSRELAPRY